MSNKKVIREEEREGHSRTRRLCPVGILDCTCTFGPPSDHIRETGRLQARVGKLEEKLATVSNSSHRYNSLHEPESTPWAVCEWPTCYNVRLLLDNKEEGE